jgi:hypothetical protein
MAEATMSLFDLILQLLNDPEERAEFEADPEEYLAKYGFEDISVDDVRDVVPLVLENTSTRVDNNVASSGDQDIDVDLDLPSSGGGSEISEASRLIQYITNNVTNTNFDQSVNQVFENVDGDIRQTFDNDPVLAIGEGAQAAGEDLTNVSAEDGGIAAGGDVDIDDSVVNTGEVDDSNLIGGDVEDSNVVTGERNVTGEDNQAVTGDGSAGAFGQGSQAVSGEDNQVLGPDAQGFIGDDNQAVFGQGNTTSFGDGDATSATSFGDGDATAANLEDVSVDDGGALSVGGDARGENTDIDVQNDDGLVNVATDGSSAEAQQVGDVEVDVDQSVDQSTTLEAGDDIDDVRVEQESDDLDANVDAV